MLRKPQVAGSFYEGEEESLRRQIKECFLHPLGPGKLPLEKPSLKERKTLGLISPHAGYMYSGPVASHGFWLLSTEPPPKSVVILGPNHRGFGSPIALFSRGEWETPLGKVKIDEKICDKILSLPSLIREDEKAHLREHSLEVQVPFLQYLWGEKLRIVPLCMTYQDRRTSIEIGELLGDVLQGEDVLLLASTDLTHYQPKETTERKDRKVLEAIESLKPEEIEKRVKKYDISMCGPGPVMATLKASLLLGVKRAELLKYSTSGEVTGEEGFVVGYASLALKTG